MALTKEELDKLITSGLMDTYYPFDYAKTQERQREFVRSLIRDCISAVTPEKQEYKTYLITPGDCDLNDSPNSYALMQKELKIANKPIDAHNQAIDTVEANTKDLLS